MQQTAGFHFQGNSLVICIVVHLSTRLRRERNGRYCTGHREHVIIYIRMEIGDRLAVHSQIRQHRRIQIRNTRSNRINLIRFIRIERTNTNTRRRFDTAVDDLHLLLRVVLGERNDIHRGRAVRQIDGKVRTLRHIQHAKSVHYDTL